MIITIPSETIQTATIKDESSSHNIECPFDNSNMHVHACIVYARSGIGFKAGAAWRKKETTENRVSASMVIGEELRNFPLHRTKAV